MKPSPSSSSPPSPSLSQSSPPSSFFPVSCTRRTLSRSLAREWPSGRLVSRLRTVNGLRSVPARARLRPRPVSLMCSQRRDNSRRLSFPPFFCSPSIFVFFGHPLSAISPSSAQSRFHSVYFLFPASRLDVNCERHCRRTYRELLT